MSGNRRSEVVKLGSFVIDLEGRLLDASESSLRWLGYSLMGDWKNNLWYRALPTTQRVLGDEWRERCSQVKDFVLCRSLCDELSAEIIVLTFEKSVDQRGHLVQASSYRLVQEPLCATETDESPVYETAFFSVPEQSVVCVRHDHHGGSVSLPTLYSWQSWIERSTRSNHSCLRKTLTELSRGSESLADTSFRIRSTEGIDQSLSARFIVVLRDANGKAILIKSTVNAGTGNPVSALRTGKYLLEYVRDSVVATDLSGTIHFWGVGAERLYGWKAEETLGRSMESFIVPSADARAERERMHTAMKEGVWSGCYRQIRKDGSSFTGSTQISLVKDESGKPIGLVGIDKDVSELLEQQREMVKLQSMLTSYQWSALRGVVMAGCCHELCQPVFAIQNLVGAAVRAIDSNSNYDSVRRSLDLCMKEIARASQVSENLRGYAGRNKLSMSRCQVRDLLADSNSLFCLQAELAGVEFRLEDATDDAHIFCDKLFVRIVIINLLRNALDSVCESNPSVRRIVLRAEARHDTVVISVHDSGLGVPNHLRDKIFTPFFTSKNEGSGIGLAMSRSIIESHGGKLILDDSETEGGATFLIVFPTEANVAPPQKGVSPFGFEAH